MCLADAEVAFGQADGRIRRTRLIVISFAGGILTIFTGDILACSLDALAGLPRVTLEHAAYPFRDTRDRLDRPRRELLHRAKLFDAGIPGRLCKHFGFRQFVELCQRMNFADAHPEHGSAGYIEVAKIRFVSCSN